MVSAAPAKSYSQSAAASLAEPVRNKPAFVSIIN